MAVKIVPIQTIRDDRGMRFSAPAELWNFLGVVTELHVVMLEPGTVRGNHVHARAKEGVIIEAAGEWELAWQLSADSVPERTMVAAGVWLVCYPPGVAHAFRNHGNTPLRLNCFMDMPLDKMQPDQQRCILIP
jgi:oxalate decarboxylase/phosphoglucose isomerase-like protein (cupin superfamily)